MKTKLMICIAVLAVTASQNSWSSAIYKRVFGSKPSTVAANPDNNASFVPHKNATGEQFEENLEHYKRAYPAAAARIDNDPKIKQMFEQLAVNLRSRYPGEFEKQLQREENALRMQTIKR